MLQNSGLSLTVTPKVKYSKREQAVFDYLAMLHPHEVTTKQIIEFVFDKEKTFHAKTTVVAVLRSLNEKLVFNSEPFRLRLGGHSGPRPMKVGIEETK